jgi:peptide/nickel transport system ATP-binding protein
MRQVGIPAPERRLSAFPHQLSGGMSQRVMIAMAIACHPKLLIADEPTTALDVTIQAQILDLLLKLQQDTGMALVLITHDMGVVAETAQRVAVQYAGQKVEEQPVHDLFADPHHPYTAALLAALPERAVERRLPSISGVVPGQFDRPPGCLFAPRCRFATALCADTVPPRQPAARPGAVPLSARARKADEPSGRGAGGVSDEIVLEARDLAKHYPISRGPFATPAMVRALDGVSFTLSRERTLAVVGESGCGKSTLARLVTMIEQPTSGSLKIAGHENRRCQPATLAALRPTVQIVFQNPYGSLNPRQRIGEALEEPLLVNTRLKKAERRERAEAMMASVGLRPEHYDRYPHMFSGGQRQRIAIARAVMLEPQILVLDEPVSALDVSIRAQVLNLLADLQQSSGSPTCSSATTLSVVRHIADEVMVMYLGRPVEQGPREQIFGDPRHPYTQALLSATPVADPTARRSSASSWPASCPRRSTRRPAAASTRAARAPSGAAASSGRRWSPSTRSVSPATP